MLRSRWLRALVVTSLVGLALTLTSARTAARPNPPSLRLLSVLPDVTAERFGTDRHLYVSPGVYLAATGGAFEIDAIRGADGTITLWQVERDAQGAHPLRRLTPPGPVHLGAGLPRFFHLTLRDSAGRTLVSRDMPFCLDAGFGLSRVDADGPDHPTYPWGCGGPLTKAAVWGLDADWASSIGLGFRTAAPDGNYTLDLTIASTYAQQLQIPAEASAASIQLTIRTETGGPCKIRIPCRLIDVARPDVRTGVVVSPTEGPVTTQPDSLPTSDGLHGAGGTPDMQALPAHNLSIEHDRRTGHDYLDFAATIWNAGSGPLVVEGFRNGAAEVMPATQFIYRDGQPVSSQVVGRFEFDKRRGHHHWHMEDIAEYDLLGQSGNRLLLSGKQSFCLAPTDAVDLTLPGADWQPDREGLWSACEGESAIWLREVLPAGWGDTYYQSVAGQSFDITGLANGHYQIRVTADPTHHLMETDYDNNVGLLPITLSGTPGHRKVSVG